MNYSSYSDSGNFQDSRPGGPGGAGGPRIRFGPGGIGSMIKALIGVTLLVYILQQFLYLIGELGLTPGLFFTDFPNRLYQPLSYMFLHSSFFHIAFNMLFLWMFGTEIERLWGGAKFLQFYIFCGLGGAALTLLFSPNSMIPIIGASGAVYGVMAAYWRYFPDRKLYLYFIFPVKVRYFIPILLFLIPIFSILFARGSGIAHLAHLGGALVGFLLVLRGSPASGTSANFFRDFLRRKKHERLTARLESNRHRAGDVMKRVDAILDKINEVGLENITDEERKFLEEASEELSRGKRHN